MFNLFFIIPIVAFIIITTIIILVIRSSLNRKINNIDVTKINDSKFLNVYKDIASGYKVAYKEAKIPIIPIVIIIISILLIVFFKTKDIYSLIPTLMSVGIPTLVITHSYKYNKEQKLNMNNGNKCEYHLIERLGKIFYDNFKELDNTNLKSEAKRIYSNSNLCSNFYDNFYLRECYNFSIKENLYVNMYNIKTERESIDSNGNTTTHTVFSGIVCKVNMDFNIKGYIKITRDYLINFNKHKVELDSSEFEKNFDATSNDKIKVMQLLTSDFMEKLNELLNRYDISFEIHILNDVMYITMNEYILNNDNPLRKPNIKETYVSYCKLKQLISIIVLFYNKLREVYS